MEDTTQSADIRKAMSLVAQYCTLELPMGETLPIPEFKRRMREQRKLVQEMFGIGDPQVQAIALALHANRRTESCRSLFNALAQRAMRCY